MVGKIFKIIRSRLKPDRDEREKNAQPAVREKKEPRQKNPAREGERAKKQEQGQDALAPKRRRRRRRKKKPAAQTGKPWSLEEFQVPEEEGKTRFHDLDLPLEIMHAVADLGFSYCTPIQAEALPHTLAGKDLIGRAQTGTGKTAAFLITFLDRFMKNGCPGRDKEGRPCGLVIAPTRELVIQIGKDAEALAKYSGCRVVTLYGGADFHKQEKKLARGADLVCATPGRLLDFVHRRILDLKGVGILVIDEADRMLDMGFIPDVRRIVNNTPPREERQTLFFSATITPEVTRLASQWTKDAVNVDIEPEHVAVETVEQITYLATADQKFKLLYNLITSRDLKKVMVFTNRRDETRRLGERLVRYGINAATISGDIPQNKRQRRLEDFRAGKIRVLVATDVAGRGIHIDGVTHVVNYTLPYEPEDYVHRIGRTGRAGETGTSVSFACEEGSFYIPEIEEYIGEPLKCVPPPPELLADLPRPVKPAPAAKDGRPRRTSGKKGGGRRRPGRGRPKRRAGGTA